MVVTHYMHLVKNKCLFPVHAKWTSGMKKFELTEDDHYAIKIAKNVARRFLKHPHIKPQQVIGIGNALYALERLPIATPGAYTEFGIEYRNFSEMWYIDFRIYESAFQIAMGGSTYDSAIGSDTISEPGWLIETDGYRNTECELYGLEKSVEEYLSIGAKIIVNDESNIIYEFKDDEDDSSL